MNYVLTTPRASLTCTIARIEQIVRMLGSQGREGEIFPGPRFAVHGEDCGVFYDDRV